MDRDLEVAKNIATNGRLFCLMLFAVSLAAFALGRGSFFGVLAVVSASPVGMSCLVDLMPAGNRRAFAALGVYAFTISLYLVLLFTIG